MCKTDKEMCLLRFEPIGLGAISNGCAEIIYKPGREFRAGCRRDYGI